MAYSTSPEEKKLCKEFGRRVASRREERGITQSELAEIVGRGAQTVSNWEQGYYFPDAYVLLKLAEALNCDLDYLVGRIETKTHDIQTVCKITGLSEKAVEKITSVKPYRDLSDLLPTDYTEVDGRSVLTDEGREKVNKKKLHYSMMVSTLSRLIETERFSGFIMAYRQFLDSVEKLSKSTLEQPQSRTDDIEKVVLSRKDATQFYGIKASDMITLICEDEFKKSMTIASENERKRIERMMEEENPDDQQEEE